MQASTYLRFVRWSAWYDLLVSWPFATPWTFAVLYGALAGMAHALGLPGTLPPADPTHVLLANLMGSVIVVWSLARILAPSVVMGRLDAAARVLFAAWQINAVLGGASWIVLGFTAVEIALGVLQLLPVRGGPAARTGLAMARA